MALETGWEDDMSENHLHSCLSKQAHYKGCYVHTLDQAGSAIGTVFLTSDFQYRGPLAEWATTTLSEQGRQQMWERMERGSEVVSDKHPPMISPLLQGQGAEKPSSSGARTSSCISAKGMEGKPTSAS